MTKQYILSSWHRSYLHPLNVDALIYTNKLDQLRPSTPPSMPTQTVEYLTPKRKAAWKLMIRSLRQVVPKSHIPMVTKIDHHIDKLKATVTSLRQ